MDINCQPEDLAMDLARTRGGSNFLINPYQIGAVLVDKNGRIFSWGWCHVGDSRLPGKSVHAEEHAIGRANKKRLRGAILCVAGVRRATRQLKERVIVARPCSEKCEGLARGYGIKKVRFSTPSGWQEILL